MSNDIFILNTDPAAAEQLQNVYPSAEILTSPELNEEALQTIIDQTFTKFFYVVNAKALISGFDFSYTPATFDAEYVHVWQNSDMVRLFNKHIVKHNLTDYTDESLKRGKVRLKLHEEEIFKNDDISEITNEPDVFVIAPLTGIGNIFAKTLNVSEDRIKVIESHTGLDATAFTQILDQCQSYFFYVVDANIQMLTDFDFTFVPSHWDREFVHVWNLQKEIRIFNRPDVESNIEEFTDDAWHNGHVSVKNIDEVLYTVFNDDEFRETLVDSKSDIYVHGGTDAPDTTNTVHFSDADIIQDILDTCETTYFYIVRSGTKVKDFDFTFLPDEQWQDTFVHIWNMRDSILFFNLEQLRENPNAFDDIRDYVVKHDEDIYESYGPNWNVYTCLDDAKDDTNEYFFIVDNDVTLVPEFKYDFIPEMWEKNKVHVWQRINPHTDTAYDYSGVYLYPKIIERSARMQYVREPGCVTQPFDVIMLSYKEEYAAESFNKLLEKAPNAKRVDGVKGIFEAHKAAAELAETPMFFVVDADALLIDSFEFNFIPRAVDYHKVYVWRSKNPINNLIYGYGGVKLFPTKAVRSSTEYKIDFTTSISADFMPIAEISNVTIIDSDPFTAWKSAFRECVKLASKVIDGQVDKDTDSRLDTWCTCGEDSKNGEYAIAGAIAGKAFGLEHSNDANMLENINNYEWLREQWNTQNIKH